MTIQSDLTETWQEKKEREDLFTARASLENLTNVLLEELGRFEEIKNSGSFATLPTELLQAFVRWETAYKDVKTLLMADSEIIDIYQWRP
ncbi:hypothetical protein KKC06_06835 [Patescibacteria group bacterium]|nr:hypothetical protein [Patescibacteria group bacterium]